MAILLLICSSVLLIAVLIDYVNIKIELKQKNKVINGNFDLCLTQVCNSLWTNYEDEEVRNYYYAHNLQYIGTATMLFNITSYRDNNELNDIIMKLYAWCEDDVFFDKATPELAYRLNAILHNYDKTFVKILYDYINNELEADIADES